MFGAVLSSRVGHVTHDVIAKSYSGSSHPHENVSGTCVGKTWCLVRVEIPIIVLQSCSWYILSAALRNSSQSTTISTAIPCSFASSAATLIRQQTNVQSRLCFLNPDAPGAAARLSRPRRYALSTSHLPQSRRRLGFQTRHSLPGFEARLNPSLDVMICSQVSARPRRVAPAPLHWAVDPNAW